MGEVGDNASEFRDQFVEALDAYRRALVSPVEADWKRYWDALDSASRSGDNALGVARQFAHEPDAGRHHVAVDLVGRVAEVHPELRDASVDVILDVIALVFDEDGFDHPLLSSTAAALGATRSERGVSFLQSCLHTDMAPLRVTAIVALGSCADASPQAFSSLIQATSDDDAEMRRWAVFGLAMRSQVDTEQLRGALATRLNDESEAVRLEAIRGLAKRKDNRAREPIENALLQPDPAPQILRAAEYLAGLRPSPTSVRT